MFPQSSHAQNQEGPKLAEITFTEENNDQKALETAKKLNPRYFELIEAGTNKFRYYAQFFNYKENEFLAFSPQDLYMICSSAGCPFFLYKNEGENSWRLVGHFYGHSIFYDLNSNNPEYPNIIIRGLPTKTKGELDVFIWDGIQYYKANK